MGKKTLAPNRSRSIAETVKRTYSEAEQKRKSEVTRKVVELYKQAEERKSRDLLRKIKQKTQRNASGSLGR
jgi:predicted phage gp36 major capsid-like protein